LWIRENGMFIPDPGIHPSRILIFIHPGSRIQQQQQKRRGKMCCPTFPCNHNYHKIKNMGWDPGSGKNSPRIPDPGVKKAPDPGFGSRIRNTQVYRLQVIHSRQGYSKDFERKAVQREYILMENSCSSNVLRPN